MLKNAINDGIALKSKIKGKIIILTPTPWHYNLPGWQKPTH